MKRKIVLIPLVLVLSLALAGVAYAVFQGRLKGNGSYNALRITWSTVDGETSSNDQAGAINDPLTFGTSPTRDTVNVGSTEAAIVSGELQVTIQGLYASYMPTVWGAGLVTGAGGNVFKVQKVSLLGTPPAGLTVGLDPSFCSAAGTSLSATTPLPIAVGLKQAGEPVAASGSFTFAVDVVPSAAYVQAQCNSWASL